MTTTRTSGGGPGSPPSRAALRALHERFVAGELSTDHLESAAVRRVVAQSWRRSLATGVNPDGRGQSVASAVDRLRSEHPLAAALPVVRRLLVDHAADAGVVVAVTAADGTLLWVEGDRDACREAAAMNFVPGADWSERGAGTNAPGTALALDQEVQIRGSEHFARIVQPWSCTAVPVHDPTTGVLLGAIDLTGGVDVASTQTLALVRATAVAIENHLALLRLIHPEPVRAATARLSVLGSGRPKWVVTDGTGRPKVSVLTGRHADILVLLTRHPEGLSADHLAILLDDNDLDAVTIRAEMSRLRRVIGAEYVASRPYRLLVDVDSDVADVFDALHRGDVAAAVSNYPGTLLGQSVSPAIARLRAELSASLRAAVLTTGDLGLLRRWLELPEGRDDREGWGILRDGAAPGSTTHATATGHLAALDLDIG